MNADLRQQIVLEMETRGTDALSVLAAAIREVEDEITKAASAYGVTDVTASKTIATIEKFTGVLGKLKQIETAAAEANGEMVQSIEKVDVGWAKLVMSGLNLQDTIRKVGEATAKVAKDSPDDLVKVDVALNKLIVDGFKFQDKLREAVITLGQLADSAQKLKSDKIVEFHANTEKLTRSFEATVISTDNLVASAQKLKSDKVQEFYQNTQKMTRAIEDAIIPVEHLVMSGLKLQDPKSLGGFASKADEAADKTKRMGQFAMNASYAFQDLQYGMGAFVNNVGLLGMSAGRAFPKLEALTVGLGGTAGLSAGLMAAGVAADLLYHNWEAIAGAFGGGVPPKLINDVKDVGAELEALTRKKWKTAIDFSDIDTLQGKTEKLAETEAAYQRLKTGKTKAEQKRAEVVNEAIVEAGGGEKLEHVLRGLMPRASSEETDRKRAEIAELDRRIANNPDDVAARGGTPREILAAGWDWSNRGALTKNRDRLKIDVKAFEAADENNRNRGVKELMGLAGKGDEKARARLAALLAGNEQKFADRGIDTSRLAAGLEMAEPKNLFADERQKEADRIANRDNELADVEHERIFLESSASGKVAHDNLQRLRKKAKEEQREAERRQKVVQDAADREGNRDAREREQAEAKAAREKAKAIKEDVARFGPGVSDALEEASLKHAAFGMNADQSTARLRAQLQARLARNGVAPGRVAAVADEILGKALDRVANQIEEEIHKRGVDSRQAASNLLDTARGKDEAQDRAATRRAQQPARDQQAEMSQQERAYRAQIKTQAMMEAAMNVVGPATLMLAQIEAMNDQLSTKINQAAANMDRARTRGKAGQMTMGNF